MKRRRRTDEGATTIAVTTSDGHRFRASVGSVGREEEPRWMLFDVNGLQYVGPPVTPDLSIDGVQRLVDEWWQSHKANP